MRFTVDYLSLNRLLTSALFVTGEAFLYTVQERAV
jgi:hypothetical protein